MCRPPKSNMKWKLTRHSLVVPQGPQGLGTLTWILEAVVSER